MSEELIKEAHLHSRVTVEVLKNVTFKFFDELGFENIGINMDSFIITRGNDFKNGITNNPMNWKSRIEINFKDDKEAVKVDCTFNISIKNQLVTEKELEVWSTIISDFEKMIETGKYDLESSFSQLKKAQKANRNIFLWTISGILISGSVGLYLAITFNLKILLFVMMILGTFTFLLIGIKKNK